MSTYDVDLRSDTVTQPTDGMWEAMRVAPLGDDVLGDEPTVIALEKKIAEMLGKEAALFTPSGTMANQLAIRSVCEGGDEIIAHHDNHIIHYETGGPAALSGCMVHGIDGPSGLFDADNVAAAIRHRDVHHPRSRMVAIENSHNRGGGCVWSIDRFESVADVARKHGIHVHVDGARLFNACVAAGYSPADFARKADTVNVCFSKGLGAPVGSAMIGSAELVERARRFRKMFGGGMRQSGILAAAAIHALDHHVDRLAVDHELAARLAAGIDRIEGLQAETPEGGIRTNIVFFQVDPRLGTAKAFAEKMTEAGVAAYDFDPTRIRMVTHLGVDTTAIDRAIDLVGKIASGPNS
ncbi:MAG: low specificity L-threonine aldolase [Planctomycetaceae bacterium]|nr:low specificity L-threonine aldolase [Planctomycetaceae bacterium]